VLRRSGVGATLVIMTHYVMVRTLATVSEFEAKGFLGTVGKIAAATVIFFIAVGLVVGLLLGFFIGRSVGRRQGPR
jgi:membrane protein DedA with SNARE-associated domain